MDEDTTTAAVDTQVTGADEAQPVDGVTTEAADVNATAEPSEAPQDVESEETQADAPQADDKLQKYAQSNGIELDSPGAIKAAQIAMKAQSAATRNHQRASELEKTVTTASDEYAEAEAAQTGQDPELLKTVRGLQVKDAVRTFWDTPLTNGTTPDRAMEQSMIAELQAKPYLAGDLESLYATAVFKSGGTDVKSQVQKETLQNLAHKQTAAVPRGNATNPGTTPKEKPFADLSIAEMEAKLGKVQR